ncbi:hypothetical protein QVD17_06286 [Tagetes erecta]|uniref:Uncharacterized protein n=1 Tax=Tagetes erecta TaxID=13708 RepID=A0AAD8LDP3_TARER|nr:hypothetical protein QVD17_06286 [Tagetes erecta]
MCFMYISNDVVSVSIQKCCQAALSAYQLFYVSQDPDITIDELKLILSCCQNIMNIWLADKGTPSLNFTLAKHKAKNGYHLSILTRDKSIIVDSKT